MNNNMHGHGTYRWKDGRKYEGYYEYDKKHGFGVYEWADGRKYEGNWSNGKQHGQGKYILSDGKIRIGVWENGKRLQWLSNQSRGSSTVDFSASAVSDLRHSANVKEFHDDKP